MVHIKTFGDPEEMRETIQQWREAALAGLAPAQADLTFGSHWVRFEDDLVIFGRVATLSEVGVAEMELGASGEEAAAMTHQISENMEAGLLYADCYSVVEVDGEVGNTHKASVWPIDESLFEQARRVDWDPYRLPDSGRALLTEAWAAFNGHRARARLNG